MPKENINAWPEPHPKDVRDGRVPPPTRIEVLWERGHLAVGASRPIPNHKVTEPPREGMQADLDREGVNRLIRALRRARDTAFGTDA